MDEYRLSQWMGPGFWESHRAIRRGGLAELVEKGGRGSGKSSFLALELVYQLLRHPDCHGAVLRRVGSTLRTSVYAQILWAIAALGLAGQFECTVSPMECRYLPTGQRIFFFGMDDAGKLKSVKPPFGYIGLVWFEELDQFDGPEQVRSAEQSLFRGGEFSLCLKSFNPPASPRAWANRYVREPRPGRLVHHSTYLQMPPGWLGPRFLADAEHLRAVNETAYRREYLGEVTGGGAAVFPNVRLEAMDDALVAGFDRVYAGVDWGWYPDPWAYNRVCFDSGRQTLYIFDELTKNRASNAETAALILVRAPNDPITADSAEAKSVADYRAAGLRCRAAVKGPGSVAYSMKWLQGLAAIVIDPNRCPDTAREFTEYEYLRSRGTGEVLEGFPDRNNHHIDAVRYALSPVWRRRGQ